MKYEIIFLCFRNTDLFFISFYISASMSLTCKLVNSSSTFIRIVNTCSKRKKKFHSATGRRARRNYSGSVRDGNIIIAVEHVGKSEASEVCHRWAPVPLCRVCMLRIGTTGNNSSCRDFSEKELLRGKPGGIALKE